MKSNLCNLCGRLCNVNRITELGFCNCNNIIKVAKAGLHYWEEPCISGTNGSGAVFFAGCSLKCVFCQNYDLSHKNFGKEISVNRLADIFKELEQKGAHNINLVTPTHFVDEISKAFMIYKPKIPVIYNTSGYDTIETIEKVSKFADIFLFDFKYITTERALKYSYAENYPKTVINAIKKAIELVPECEFNKDIMKKGIIIRHLLLPQGTNEAIRIIDWLIENANNCYFSLMAQYTPIGNLENHKEINRKITDREYEKVVAYLIDKKLKHVFLQDTGSSTTEYIPNFDLEGV